MVTQLIRSKAQDPKETLTPSSLPCKAASPLTHPFPPMQVHGTLNTKPFPEWAGLHGRIRGHQTDRGRKEESLQEGLACAKALWPLAASRVVREMWKGFQRCAKEVQSYWPVRLSNKKCESHSQRS